MPMEILQTLNDKAQARREGGQFLILSPQEGLAAALSALPFDLHYDKVNNIPSPRKKTTHCIPNRAYFPFSTVDVYKEPANGLSYPQFATGERDHQQTSNAKSYYFLYKWDRNQLRFPLRSPQTAQMKYTEEWRIV